MTRRHQPVQRAPHALLACQAALSDNRRNAWNKHKTHNDSRNLPDRPAPDTGLRRGNRRTLALYTAGESDERRGNTLKPKVFCIGELANQGAGHPDFACMLPTGAEASPREARSQNAVWLKSSPPATTLADRGQRQVSRYWERYRLVLVTNTRDFVLVGRRRRRPSDHARNLSLRPRPLKTSPGAWKRPAPLPVPSAPGSENISVVPCPTGPR